MAYYAFDLDETLANVFTPFYMICSLRPILTAQEDKIPMNLPDTLTDAMRNAYFIFVHLVAERENSDKPLGILRPGLIRCFEEIQSQYEEGLCKGVVFYSNNGSLGCLEFVRDVLQDALGNPHLICECAHWSHPFRTHEIDPLIPGSGKKTWATLKRLLTDGMCDATKEIGPQDVMFFDDLIHPDLHTTLGPYGNYVHVKPYTYKSSITDVLSLYQQALREAGILGTNFESTFTKTIQRLGHPIRTSNGHFQDIRRNTLGTMQTGTLPPIEGNGSEDILSAIQAFGNRRRNELTPTGGKRVLRRDVQQAKRKKSRKQQRGRL
jgi:hypothetical protein